MGLLANMCNNNKHLFFKHLAQCLQECKKNDRDVATLQPKKIPFAWQALESGQTYIKQRRSWFSKGSNSAWFEFFNSIKDKIKANSINTMVSIIIHKPGIEISRINGLSTNCDIVSTKSHSNTTKGVRIDLVPADLIAQPPLQIVESTPPGIPIG
jgi:hypothetical protein